MHKRDYTFRMNVMEEIFEIRSCIEISSKLLFRSSPNTDRLYTFYVSQGSSDAIKVWWYV